MRKIIGLDIGGTKCAVLLAQVDSKIHIIQRLCFPTQAELGFEHTRDKLFDCIRQIMQDCGVSSNDISAIGVSCGGPLDSRRGIVLCPPNLPGWINIPITDMLEQTFGIPAYLQNDAKACALVEWKMGAGRGSRNMMFLTMGTGMGAGIIAEGKLVCGACDMGGEIGHIRIEEDGPIGFGKRGSFEGFTSGGGIARLARERARKALAEGHPFAFGRTEEEIDNLSTREVAKFAKNGDADAMDIFDQVGEKLGKGLSYFIDTLNPEVIVIGSIFCRCENLLRTKMEEVLKAECISYSRAACRIVPAETGEQIGDYASVMVALYGSGYDFDRDIAPDTLQHLNELANRFPQLKACEDDILEAYSILQKTFDSGKKLLLCNEGENAAGYDHIAAELMKGFRLSGKISSFFEANQSITQQEADVFNSYLQKALPAIALTGQPASNSPYANDTIISLGFAQQVFSYGSPGDVLLAIDAAGNSEKVIYAAQVAKHQKMSVIALTGNSDAKLRQIADVCICVPAGKIVDIEKLQLSVCHTIYAMLETAFFCKEAAR